MIRPLLLFSLLLWAGVPGSAQTPSPDPREIIQKVQDKSKGESSQGEMKMTIIRPTWQREMRLKMWTKSTDYALILVTAPARDKGTAFLKRKKELWNWQPSIDRVIKLPPSMMMQSWMGSDFTNDDMVQQADPVEDFTHRLLGIEEVDGRPCYKIEMTPHEDAPVAWGKILTWIDTEEYIELKAEFYDEDGYLVHTLYGKNVKEMGGRVLPSVLEVIPAEEEGHKTIVEQLWIAFDKPIPETFFTVQNLRRVR